MADLTGVNQTLPTRIGGVSSTSGLPDFYADVTSIGQLKIVNPSDGPVAPGTAASNSILIGGQYNSTAPSLTSTQQSAIQLDSSGRLIVNVATTAPPNNLLSTGTLTGLGQSVNLTLQGTASINVDVSGTWVGTIIVTETFPSGGRTLGVFALNASPIASSITANGNYRVVAFSTNSNLTVSFSSYTSGSATINIYGSTAPFIVMPYSANAANVLVTSYLNDGAGNSIGSDTATNGNQYLRVSSVQSIITSTNNSTTTNLGAGASFTGISENLPTEGLIDILVSADQPCTVQVQQSPDGTNWDIKDVYYTFSNVADARLFDTVGNYYRVIVTNTGTLSTTYLRVQTRLIPSGTVAPRALTQYGNLATAVMETSPMGAIATQLFFDSFDVGLDTINKWNTPVSAGGGSAATTTTLGYTQLGSGTTANGYSYLQTQGIFKQTSPGFLASMYDINVEFPVITNAYRFWGMANLPATPTASAPITNGIGFEISTAGKMYAITYATGTRNVIQDLSTSGTNAQPTDNLAHKYYLFFRGDLAFWAIDELNNIVATMRTGAPGPTANNLPFTMLAIAGSTAPSSNGLITNNGVFLGDTSGSNLQISDGTYPWRKLTVDSSGNLSAKTLDGSGNAINSYNSQLDTVDIINTSISSGSITVGTSAVAARVGSSNLTNRKMLMISPSTYTVYMGYNSSVTTSTGIPIFPGQVVSFSFSSNVTPYLISATSGTVNIFEGA